MSEPTYCARCRTDFFKGEHKMLGWTELVAVHIGPERVGFLCPTCWPEVLAFVKDKERLNEHSKVSGAAF